MVTESRKFLKHSRYRSREVFTDNVKCPKELRIHVYVFSLLTKGEQQSSTQWRPEALLSSGGQAARVSEELGILPTTDAGTVSFRRQWSSRELKSSQFLLDPGV